MVRFFGEITQSTTVNGVQVMRFRIPALSKSIAKRRAKANARIKNLSDGVVSRVEVINTGSIPGQKIFSIEIKERQ